MIKLLRRMTIIGMVLAMCVSCLTPIAFATSVENSDKNSIWNFVGCSAYEADIVNLSNSALSVDFLVKNTSTSPFASFSIPAQSVVAKIVTKPSWYARFKCPCDVSGNVFKYVMH